MISDKDRGLYVKFHVERTDGRSAQGEKHHGCQYFVLDVARRRVQGHGQALRVL